MLEIGLSVPRSGIAHTMEEADAVLKEIGLPVIIRPAYILGGRGTGIANTMEEFAKLALNGLDASPIREILVETSIVGWKEYELEVMRDKADNCVIICSIENFDPMGVHTGDSITVAPAQTLSDVEYQNMRDAAFAEGCAFWDMYSVMGGKNSMISWVKNNPPYAGPDYTHFTPGGARKVADLLYKSILREYEAWHAAIK
jgi:acetyl/propionyl-CoA carboxylase alpha subunit